LALVTGLSSFITLDAGLFLYELCCDFVLWLLLGKLVTELFALPSALLAAKELLPSNFLEPPIYFYWAGVIS